jgi:ribonuclease HI
MAIVSLTTTKHQPGQSMVCKLKGTKSEDSDVLTTTITVRRHQRRSCRGTTLLCGLLAWTRLKETNETGVQPVLLVLFKCKEVHKVWRELNLEQTRCRLAEAQPAMALKMKGREQLTVIMLLWLWWGERNKWREEGRRRTAANLAYIAEFHADLASKTDGRLLSDFRQRTQWQRPRAGELKLNTDGAFNGDKHDGGWGFLIRDDQGRVVSSGAGREDFLLYAFQAELLGCLAGLQEATKLGIQSITLQVDAALVQEAIQTDAFRLASSGGVITEIKQLIGAEFVSCSISVCKRDCNKVAHSLCF